MQIRQFTKHRSAALSMQGLSPTDTTRWSCTCSQQSQRPSLRGDQGTMAAGEHHRHAGLITGFYSVDRGLRRRLPGISSLDRPGSPHSRGSVGSGANDDDRRAVFKNPQFDTNGKGESEGTEASTPQANKRQWSHNGSLPTG